MGDETPLTRPVSHINDPGSEQRRGGGPWAVVCGESLTDYVPKDDIGEDWRAIPGGSPFNTSLALARLSMPTALFSRLSTDGLGERAYRLLRREGVDDSFLQRTESPTTLALVNLGSRREATYSFYWTGTSNDDWSSDEPVPRLDPHDMPAVVHVASIAAVISPSRDVLYDWYTGSAPGVPLSFDVNVRPVMLGDRREYLDRLHQWLEAATVIKASEEDLGFLFPGEAPADIAPRLLKEYPKAELAMVTMGGDGVGVFRRDQPVHTVTPPKIEVVDTVGAGDTFTAATSRVATTSGSTSTRACAAPASRVRWPAPSRAASRPRRPLSRRRWPRLPADRSADRRGVTRPLPGPCGRPGPSVMRTGCY